MAAASLFDRSRLTSDSKTKSMEDENETSPVARQEPDQRRDDNAGELRSFGRRRGRKLRPRKSNLFKDKLPAVALDIETPAPDPLERIFVPDGEPPEKTPSETWLEIGFGGAEHLLWQAENNSQVGLIGCEPFEGGVVKALAGIEEKHLSNIRLHADDARDVLRWLPEASLARVFILFPDPWPKKRHVKRRLISPQLLKMLARVMKPGAELRIGTDIGDYLRTILIAFQAEKSFQWSAEGPMDWRIRPPDWPQTRYEQKARREGRLCYYLIFKKRNDLQG